jgi:hypothetical protein
LFPWSALSKIERPPSDYLEDDSHHPRFVETIVGKGYRFIEPLISADASLNPAPQLQLVERRIPDDPNKEDSEIRLRGFLVETADGLPILTCDVIVSNIALGRLPLLQLELPADVSLPLKPEDRLLLKLHGMNATLTSKAAKALHAFSISVLHRGLRTREADFRP